MSIIIKTAVFLSVLCSCLCVLIACDDGERKSDPQHEVSDQSVGQKDQSTIQMDQSIGQIDQSTAQTDQSTAQTSEANRPLRRMSLKQLAQSIPIVTKGIRWTEDFGQGEVDLLNLLAPTFGAADYLTITEENLEPNLLMAKFMNDASKRLCQRLVEREVRLNREWQALGLNIAQMQAMDWQQPQVKALTDQQVLVIGDFLWVDHRYVQSQIQRLMGLFLGDAQIQTDHPRFGHYWSMFQLIEGSMPSQDVAYWGYFSLCVGLFTDPEFLMY